MDERCALCEGFGAVRGPIGPRTAGCCAFQNEINFMQLYGLRHHCPFFPASRFFSLCRFF